MKIVLYIKKINVSSITFYDVNKNIATIKVGMEEVFDVALSYLGMKVWVNVVNGYVIQIQDIKEYKRRT